MPTLGPQIQLDRMSPKRADPAWVEAKLKEPASRLMVLVDLKPCIVSQGEGQANEARSGEIRWFTLLEVKELGLDTTEVMFLGADHATGKGYFALSITEHFARHVPNGPYCLKPYVDLRTLSMQGVLTPEELALCGQARSLGQWHDTHRCCSKCGGQNHVKDAGWRRKCWSCGMDHFPRTDPVVIMLVTDGERCLLAHEKRYVQMYGRKFYSTLAGFLEPGEDIEAAVRREVREEVGIDVDEVRYYRSQPWPFPHSLMIGCIAKARSAKIEIDPAEIDDAIWVSREDARAALEGTHPNLAVPGKHAIAHHLIKAFVEGK